MNYELHTSLCYFNLLISVPLEIVPGLEGGLRLLAN